MTLYTCTKNPPCTDVTGHRTPVCPKATSNLASSVSKLKADALGNSKSRKQPNPDTAWAGNPQAAEIDSVIERISRLTMREARALSKAREKAFGTTEEESDKFFASGEAAVDMVERKNRYAALDTVGDVIADKAENTAWNEIWSVGEGVANVTWDTVLCLFARDLINEKRTGTRKHTTL